MIYNTPMRFLLIIFSLLFFPAFANECIVRGVSDDAPVLCGHATQGGFLYGESDWRVKAAAGNLTYKDGVFVVGIPMDAPKILTLKFCAGGLLNRCRAFDYKITQRKYREQHVNVDRKFIEYPPQIQTRIDAEREKIRAARDIVDTSFLEFLDFRYPFDKKWPMTSVYGSRRVFNGVPMSPHNGIDIAAPRGTPIRSIGRGVVTLTLDSYLNGKTVVIAHGFGIFSVYIHLDRIDARAGDAVTHESIIGTVGATGRVSGPHLHLGLYHKNTALDPALLFQS